MQLGFGGRACSSQIDISILTDETDGTANRNTTIRRKNPPLAHAGLDALSTRHDNNGDHDDDAFINAIVIVIVEISMGEIVIAEICFDVISIVL